MQTLKKPRGSGLAKEYPITTQNPNQPKHSGYTVRNKILDTFRGTCICPFLRTIHTYQPTGVFPKEPCLCHYLTLLHGYC
jgi:hypothetical protein